MKSQKNLYLIVPILSLLASCDNRERNQAVYDRLQQKVSAETELKDKPREDILLVKETGTRSGTITQVNAYINGDVLIVEVENYGGDVFVLVSGTGGTSQVAFSCHESGYGELDISSLPEGAYTVRITMNHTYTGNFVK